MPNEDNDKSAEDLFPERKGITYDPHTGRGDNYSWGDGPKSLDWWIHGSSGVLNLENQKAPVKKPERFTFFLDIDGTLLRHFGNKPEQFQSHIEVLPNVAEFFSLCGKYGHIVILTSGRRESMREITELQLKNAGISFDQLILGCSNAIRVLVNDTKPYRTDSPPTAIAFNLVRDTGVAELVKFIKENENGT